MTCRKWDEKNIQILNRTERKINRGFPIPLNFVWVVETPPSTRLCFRIFNLHLFCYSNCKIGRVFCILMCISKLFLIELFLLPLKILEAIQFFFRCLFPFWMYTVGKSIMEKLRLKQYFLPALYINYDDIQQNNRYI